MTHIYTIIPNLVSIETNATALNDFLLSQDLEFYGSKKQKNHYTVIMDPAISLPKIMGYRIGNYIISDSVIAYRRPITLGKGFEFNYNYRTKTFIFNLLYRYHYVNIGDIFTVGRHLFHTLEYDLAKEGQIIILGAAVIKNGHTAVALAPHCNGKTEFVHTALTHGYQYIAENFLVIDSVNNLLYGTAPLFHNKGRSSNIALEAKFTQNSTYIGPTSSISKIYLSVPSSLSGNPKTRIANYIITYTGYYKKNNLLRSLAYYKLKNIQLETTYKKLTSYLTPKVSFVPQLSNIPL